MLAYLGILLMPAIFSLTNAKRLSPGLWLIVFVSFFLFVGLRYEVGPDWATYVVLHQEIVQQEPRDIALKPEPLSHLLFWLSATFDAQNIITNCVAAAILMLGVFSFARRTVHPWLAVTAVTPYLILVIGTSAVRQSIAVGILLFLLACWEHTGIKRRIVNMLMAAMCHTSALAASVLLLLDWQAKPRIKLGVALALLSVLYVIINELSFFADNIAQYEARYLEDSEFRLSPGALYHIGFIAIPALLGLLFRRRIMPLLHHPALFRFGLYATLAVLLLNFISSKSASQLSLYLYFIPMMIYPALAHIAGPRGVPFLTLLIVLFHITTLVAWFEFEQSAYHFLPYQNLIQRIL